MDVSRPGPETAGIRHEPVRFCLRVCIVAIERLKSRRWTRLLEAFIAQMQASPPVHGLKNIARLDSTTIQIIGIICRCDVHYIEIYLDLAYSHVSNKTFL